MMAASVLQSGCVCLENCPEIADVVCMGEILESIGAKVWRENKDLYIDCQRIDTAVISGAYADKMRSSVILMGALLGRKKSVRIGYPGGCVIGERPIDLHIAVLRALGARVEEENQMLSGSCERLLGTHYRFPKRSVGATENGILAAVTADGITVLDNCAKEPEIVHLCLFLNEMGAQIKGAGTSRIRIRGCTALHETKFGVPSDRIVAGTYLLAGAVTKGRITLLDAPIQEMRALLSVYLKMGGQYEVKGGKLIADSRGVRYPPGTVKTACYPGFPTDLQSPLLAVCAVLPGTSRIEEKIFEDRYRAAEQMRRMGADIRITGSRAQIHGGSLYGTSVTAKDLRGGAALVLAGLAACGTTTIREIYHVERGYQDICRDIQSLGGNMVKRTGETLLACEYGGRYELCREENCRNGSGVH